MLNFVQVFESNKTTRHTQDTHATGCLFLKAGVCLSTPYPSPHYTPPPPLSLCAAVVVLVSCRFQAAEQQLQSEQTFPYILIHFYCHAHEHTGPHRSPALSSALLNSKKQQPSGRWKFFFPFPSLLGKHKEKRKNFFCTMNFCAFSTCMSWSSPPPATITPSSCRKSIRCACRLPDCEKFPFSILFFPLVVAAKVTALG